MKASSVVVTGSAGAVGSHMAERLSGEGRHVVGIDALTDYYAASEKERTAQELAKKGIETHRIDLAKDSLKDAIPQDTEFIFHFAAQPGIADHVSFETYLSNNVEATERLVAYAEKLPNLKGFIYISTSSVYGAQAVGNESSEPRPTSWYGVTKLAAEQLVLASARRNRLPAASARLFSVYGERERPDKLFRKLITSITAGTSLPLYEGSRAHKRSFTHVADIVDGLMAMYAHWDKARGEIFNLGSDEVHTTGEAIDLIELLTGKEAAFVSQPPRQGDQVETSADIAKARAVLGYEPKVSLKEGLAREIAWCNAAERL